MQGFELVAILVATWDLHFPGPLRAQGALWNGKLAAESLGHVLAVRKTDRLHFWNGLGAQVPRRL